MESPQRVSPPPRALRRSLDLLRAPRASMDFARRAHSHHAAPFPAPEPALSNAPRPSRRLSTRTDAPLYLFRAPGLQARIGLRRDVFAPGDTVDGAVILYRDADSASHPRVTATSVDVHLYCE
eukprot:IDg20656t1